MDKFYGSDFFLTIRDASKLNHRIRYLPWKMPGMDKFYRSNLVTMPRTGPRMVQEPQAISMFQSRVFLLRHDSRDGVSPEYLADISFCGSYQLQ